MNLMTRKLLTVGAAVVILGGAVARSLLVWGSAAEQPAANPLPPATAQVTRTTLVETRTVLGTLGYGDPVPISATGTGTLTWIAPVGSTVERGEPLFKVDGRPVVVLYGSVPLYRTLRVGGEGVGAIASIALEDAAAAVQEAELNLALERARLADAEARRAEADRRLADSVRDDPQTPEFIQLRRAVRSAKDRLEMTRNLLGVGDMTSLDVQDAEDDLAIARANLDAAIEEAPQQIRSAEIELASAQLAVLWAERQMAEARDRLEALEAEAIEFDSTLVQQFRENLAALGYTGFTVDGIYDSATAEAVRAWQADLGLTGTVGPGQVVFLPGPVRIAEHAARVGDTLDGGPVLSYTGTTRLVTVQLNVADQALAALGREVTVTVPGRGAVEGTISQVGIVVRDDEIEVTVRIADQEGLGSLTAAPVDVDFVSQERADVLAVPVAALLALAEGGYGVEVVDGDTTRIVAVRTGMFAAGRVEVSGEGIGEGVTVGVPR